MKAKISIIIPTKNEEGNIERCIESVKESGVRSQELGEVIVVDNKSTDKTVEMAKRLGARVFQAGPERSAQRNFGAKKSKSEYLLFLDADMEIKRNVINECLNLAKKGFPAIIISEKVMGKGFWSQCRALEKSCYLGDKLIEAARFYKKDLFLKLDGYDEKMVASEDWDLHQRAKKVGVKMGRTRSFVLHHEKETNPLQAAKKKYYYGLNLAYYLKKHPQLALSQYQPLRPAFWRNTKKLLNQPALTIGLIFLKLGEYFGGALGLIRGKLNESS